MEEAKEINYRRLLNKTRKGLPLSDRLLSRWFHQPFVNSLSELVASTFGRPAGLVGSGSVTFFGSLVYYSLSRHYGYDYNFLIFIFLLLVGYTLGWAYELLKLLFKGNSEKSLYR